MKIPGGVAKIFLSGCTSGSCESKDKKKKKKKKKKNWVLNVSTGCIDKRRGL